MPASHVFARTNFTEHVVVLCITLPVRKLHFRVYMFMGPVRYNRMS